MVDKQRWKMIQPAIDEFQSFLSPEVPPLEIIEANDREWKEKYEQLRPKGFPSRLRGVYLIFDAEERLQYIGVATVNFDKRVWSHDDYVDRRFTDVISFDDKFIFLAQALEHFLILKLRPPKNKALKG